MAELQPNDYRCIDQWAIDGSMGYRLSMDVNGAGVSHRRLKKGPVFDSN